MQSSTHLKFESWENSLENTPIFDGQNKHFFSFKSSHFRRIGTRNEFDPLWGLQTK